MRCSTRLVEAIVLSLVLLALAACATRADVPRLSVGKAMLDGDGVRVMLRYHPSATQLVALDDGVPLALRVRVLAPSRAPLEYRLALRWFPLSRRYQLHVGDGEDMSFAVRGYLFAALENLRLPLPPEYCDAATPCRIDVAQDNAELPGALRLPALFDPAWRVRSAHAAIAAPST